MSIPQETKDSVKVKLKAGFTHTTRDWEELTIVNIDNSMAPVEFQHGDRAPKWLTLRDIEEMAVFFEKLAKKLKARGAK